MSNLENVEKEKTYTEEEMDELVYKVNKFIDMLNSKYGESNFGEVNIAKVDEVRNFICENELFNLNLNSLGLNNEEISALEHTLKVSVFRSSKEITYVPQIPEGFIEVEKLKEDGVIFKEYWDLVPNTCSSCESKIVSNYALTIIKCSNMRCQHNLASSLRKIAIKESIPGLGGKTCFSYFQNGRLKSVIDVFEYPDAKLYDAYQRLKMRKREYSEWVKLLSFPGIEAQANILFKGINSYDDYLNEVNKNGGLFNFCLSRLGGEGKQAGNISQVLEAYDYELQRIEDIFPIGVEAERIVDIAMTGNIHFVHPQIGRMTKQKFLDFINNIYPEYVSFRQTASVNKAYMVISDYVSDSSKYRAGKSQNKLITSESLVRSMLNTEGFIKLFFPSNYKDKLEKLKLEKRFFSVSQ